MTAQSAASAATSEAVPTAGPASEGAASTSEPVSDRGVRPWIISNRPAFYAVVLSTLLGAAFVIFSTPDRYRFPVAVVTIFVDGYMIGAASAARWAYAHRHLLRLADVS